jgi:hypothetical protein
LYQRTVVRYSSRKKERLNKEEEAKEEENSTVA